MPEIPLTFENGLYEGQEASLLPVGFATKLDNWVAEPNGSLRCRCGWLKSGLSGAPATRRGRGIGFRGKAYETPDLVQSNSATVSQVLAGATTYNVATAWPSATNQGNLLVYVVAVREPSYTAGPGATPLEAALPAGVTSVINESDDTSTEAGLVHLRVGYIENASSRSGAVTGTFGQSGGTLTGLTATASIHIFEFSGAATLDQSNKARTSDAGGTSVASGTTSTTTQANELLFAAMLGDENRTFSGWTNSFTEITDTGGAATAYRVVEATGTYSTTATLSGNANDRQGAILTFKAKRPPAGVSETLVAHDTTTAYKIYGSEDYAASPWIERDSITVVSDRPVSFAMGLGGTVYTNPDFATLRRWSGTAAAAVTDGPAGRTVAFHQDRFFVGGTLALPTRLSFSKVGDYTDWTTSVDADDAGFVDVGQDDGFAIESLCVFEAGLFIAKGNSLWFLTGETSSEYVLNPLNGGGAAPGNSVCTTPYGVVIADTDTVWLWGGQGVETISEGIENSYQITGFASVSYIDGHAYICDSGTGIIYSVDLQTGVWQTETVSDANEAPAVIASHRGKLLYAPKAATTASLLQHRSHPKEIRAKDFIDETFEMWTPEYRLGGVTEAMTPKRLKMALRQRGNGDTPMTFTPYYDGSPGTPIPITPNGEGTFIERIGVGEKQGIEKVQFRFSHTVTDECLLDIEAMSLEYELTAR